MSTNTLINESDPASVKPGKYSWRQDLRSVRILRLAVGTTVAMAIAQGINWPVSFITPALVASMLTMPSPSLTWKETLKNILYAVCALSIGLTVTLFLLPFPFVFILAYGLIFFFMRYYMHKGAPFFLILMLVLTTTIIPLVGNVHEGLSNIIASYILFGICLAVIIIQLAYGVFPDPPGGETAAQVAFQAGYSSHAAVYALQSTLVVLPAMIAFLTFGWQVHLVAMLYTAIISLEGGMAHSKMDAEQYLVANLGGGMAALVFYLLIVALPAYHFLVALMFLTTLVFGEKAFSNSPTARYYPSALTGLVILVSSSTGPGVDMSVIYFKRLLYIALASVYVIAATSVLDRYIFDRWKGGH